MAGSSAPDAYNQYQRLAPGAERDSLVRQMQGNDNGAAFNSAMRNQGYMLNSAPGGAFSYTGGHQGAPGSTPQAASPTPDVTDPNFHVSDMVRGMQNPYQQRVDSFNRAGTALHDTIRNSPFGQSGNAKGGGQDMGSGAKGGGNTGSYNSQNQGGGAKGGGQAGQNAKGGGMNSDMLAGRGGMLGIAPQDSPGRGFVPSFHPNMRYSQSGGMERIPSYLNMGGGDMQRGLQK